MRNKLRISWPWSRAIKRLLLIALLAVPLFAQADGDDLVTVPKKFVSSEGLQHTAAPGVSQWVGLGKEVGIATKEGLEAVTDVANKFGSTTVGHFVMFMIAWKIMGRQMLAIFLGIPIWAVGVAIWLYSMRRFFWGARVLVKINTDKSKEYKTEKYDFYSSDAKGAAGAAHAIMLSVWCGIFLLILFA